MTTIPSERSAQLRPFIPEPGGRDLEIQATSVVRLAPELKLHHAKRVLADPDLLDHDMEQTLPVVRALLPQSAASLAQMFAHLNAEGMLPYINGLGNCLGNRLIEDIGAPRARLPREAALTPSDGLENVQASRGTP